MKASAEILNQEFASLADAIGAHAVERPEAIALMLGEETVDYGTLYSLMQRVAYSLQREGVVPQSTIAICAQTSLNYAVVLLGAVMMGVTVAPLVVTSTPETLATMISDADAKLLFVDGASRSALSSLGVSPRMVDLEPLRADASWLAPKSSVPQPVEVRPEWAFNILYSSGTTGVPKGNHPDTRSSMGRSAPAGWPRIGDLDGGSGSHATLLQHNAYVCLTDIGAGRFGCSDGQVRRRRVP